MLNWLFLGYPGYGYGSPLGYGNPYAPPQLIPPREPDQHLEARLHSLELACAGLWELLKQKNGYTDQQLIDIIKQIDTQRGAQVGGSSDPNTVCPKCGHKMLTHNHTKCLWCGCDLSASPI